MAVQSFSIAVANLDQVLLTFDRIKVYRASMKEGSYVEITVSATRPVLEEGTVLYTYVDGSATETDWYRATFYNSTTGQESSFSEPVQGTDSSALSIISVDALKTNYLFGLDLTDDDGNEYPDSLYEFFIKSAVSWVEHRLDLKIAPTAITGEKHDYFRDDFAHWMFIQLEEYPVISVEEVKLVLPGEQVTQVFDDDWIHIQKHSGQLQLVPGAGSSNSVLLGSGGQFLPLLYRHQKLIPDVFRVTYTAGFETGKVPANIVDLIGKVASFGPLNIAGDLLGGAGIASQSLSMDGLSQSFNTTSSATNAGYGARLLQYGKEAKEQIPVLRQYYKGIGAVVV